MKLFLLYHIDPFNNIYFHLALITLEAIRCRNRQQNQQFFRRIDFFSNLLTQCLQLPVLQQLPDSDACHCKSDVNLNKILRATFFRISFLQKIRNPICKHRKAACKTLSYIKGACKILVILSLVDNFNNTL